MSTRIIVTGGRNQDVTKAVEAWLLKLIADLYRNDRDLEVFVGDASGVDAAVRRLGHSQSWIPVRVFRADWRTHGRAAGPRRNGYMALIAKNADKKLCVHFPGGNGTKSMVKAARKWGLEIIPAPDSP